MTVCGPARFRGKPTELPKVRAQDRDKFPHASSDQPSAKSIPLKFRATKMELTG
jgi:hypothetical protein